MTEISKEMITIAHKLDNYKQFIGAISDDRAKETMANGKSDMFTLYMAYLSVYGSEAMSYENEAIDSALSDFSQENGDRLKAVTSILEHDSYYVDISAFCLAIEAVNGLDMSASTIEEYDADQIILTLIVMAGIDGSLTIPIKTKILSFIKACLDFEGWIAPPLELMFQNIEDYYDEEIVSEINLKFGRMSQRQIYHLDNIGSFGITRRADLQNYIIKEQEATIYVKDKISEIHDNWAYLVSGS